MITSWREADDERRSDPAHVTLLESLPRNASLTALRRDIEPPFQLKGRTFLYLGLTGQAGGRLVSVMVSLSVRTSCATASTIRFGHPTRVEPGPKINNPDPEFPQIWQLLRQTAREAKDIAPNLSGALMRSILTVGPYPQTFANGIISRIRADRVINYLRAACLKAWLVRNHQQSVPMTYDPEKPDPAYRLGALFALLEKTQGDALGDVNASIRDRFYSSASATPASVFPRLLRTYQHHLTKAGAQNKGYQIHREREVQAILGEPTPLAAFPSHLNLRDQGLFAIGYYHKRKDIWTKKGDSVGTDSEARHNGGNFETQEPK